MFKNKLLITSAIGAFFIASCSNEMAVEPTSEDNSYSEFVDALESTGGKAFAEFMACEAGADFNAENATKMISDWQKLITAESLFGVWGYVPASDTNAFGDTLWWELNWNSKEEADAEWTAWVQNEDAQAWAEKYSNVMEKEEILLTEYIQFCLIHTAMLMKADIFMPNFINVNSMMVQIEKMQKIFYLVLQTL